MHATVAAIFMALDMPEADAQQAADVLIYADVRGIDSHGVSNMMRVYVDWLTNAKINPKPSWKVERDTGPAITVNGDNGLGLAIAPPIMEMAIERARRFGVAFAVQYNAGHYGASAYYAHQALDHGMIGISSTAGGVLVAPTGGAEKMMGLNPLGIAVPSGRAEPFIFDAALSSLAYNKIRLLQRIGGTVAPGWVSKADGDPVMAEQAVPDDFMMLPLGGTREIGSHKGMGLLMMIEVMTTLLGGTGGGPFRRQNVAHQFMVLDIEKFCDKAVFEADMEAYLARLLATTPAPGEARVVYPGIPEAEAERDRRTNGIPYHPEVIDWFRGTCARLKVPHALPD